MKYPKQNTKTFKSIHSEIHSILIINFLRSNKEVLISAGGFTNVSFETFMKVSYLKFLDPSIL